MFIGEIYVGEVFQLNFFPALIKFCTKLLRYKIFYTPCFQVIK